MWSKKIGKIILEEKLEPIVNPVRGWYGLNSYDLGTDDSVGSWMDEQPIQLLVMNLGAFAQCDLPENVLEKIKNIISAFARAEKDIILRLVYDQEGKGMEKEPGSFERVIRHFEQLSPVLMQCKDKIWIYQGVLVGSWGEMHTSKFLSDEKYCQLEQCLYEIFGEDVFLAVRKPRFERVWKETSVECGKMAIFDDAILASETDLGTFAPENPEEKRYNLSWNREAELKYVEENCADVPNGGELVWDAKEAYCPELHEIVDTMRQMHLTYLNRYYDEVFLNRLKEMTWSGNDAWKGMDGFTYIAAHLGYRFCIRSVEFWTDRMQILIDNTGFGMLTEEAECWIQREDEEPVLLPTYPHEWQGQVEIIWEEKLLPGKYYIFLRRKRDGRSIRFANSDDAKGHVFLGSI